MPKQKKLKVFKTSADNKSQNHKRVAERKKDKFTPLIQPESDPSTSASIKKALKGIKDAVKNTSPQNEKTEEREKEEIVRKAKVQDTSEPNTSVLVGRFLPLDEVKHLFTRKISQQEEKSLKMIVAKLKKRKGMVQHESYSSTSETEKSFTMSDDEIYSCENCGKDQRVSESTVEEHNNKDSLADEMIERDDYGPLRYGSQIIRAAVQGTVPCVRCKEDISVAISAEATIAWDDSDDNRDPQIDHYYDFQIKKVLPQDDVSCIDDYYLPGCDSDYTNDDFDEFSEISDEEEYNSRP